MTHGSEPFAPAAVFERVSKEGFFSVPDGIILIHAWHEAHPVYKHQDYRWLGEAFATYYQALEILDRVSPPDDEIATWLFTRRQVLKKRLEEIRPAYVGLTRLTARETNTPFDRWQIVAEA
jgi:hypothetical protein